MRHESFWNWFTYLKKEKKTIIIRLNNTFIKPNHYYQTKQYKSSTFLDHCQTATMILWFLCKNTPVVWWQNERLRKFVILNLKMKLQSHKNCFAKTYSISIYNPIQNLWNMKKKTFIIDLEYLMYSKNG